MSSPKLQFPKQLFNPVYWHIEEAFKDPDVRNVLIYGGSSAGKTYSISQNLVYNAPVIDNSTMIFRKESTTIDETVYADFKSLATQINNHRRTFIIQDRKIKCAKSRFVFSGMDDPEKAKGISQFKKVYMNELSKFELEDWNEIQRRLRGRPNLQIVADWNPVSDQHWIKTDLIDKDEWIDLPLEMPGNKYSRLDKDSFKHINKAGDTILIKVTYKDNYWVVGSPCGTYGFYDKHTIVNFNKMQRNNEVDYMVYALGEWGVVKTGGEFFHAFSRSKHVSKYPYNDNYPVHVSVDNNVLPYISIRFDQIIDGKARQFHEICAKDPFNTVSKAGELTRIYLEEIGYSNVVYLYGDASTKAGNTIDDEKRTFLDKFEEKIGESFIVENRVPDSNPSVSMSGEFINEILSGSLEGLSIGIDESCKTSISDYETVKKDVNGGMLKVRIKNKSTLQTYEEHGHLSDTLRYFITTAFKDEYIRFANRRKRNSYKNKDDMLYFNSDAHIKYGSKVYFVMPDCNGKMTIAKIGVHNYADVVDIVFTDKYNESVIISLADEHPDLIIFECNKSYFPVIRVLREKNVDVRGMSEHAKLHHRISANENIIKKKFRFRDDYDSIGDYVEFMNSIMDYNGKDNHEAINLLSMAAHYINRTYFMIEK